MYTTYGYNCIFLIMDKIFKTKFKKEIIYIHNLNFDGFLIIEALTLNKINQSLREVF